MTKKEKLVDLLRQDARLSNEQLAAMLDTSADDVAAMIAELEKSGMIIGYTAIINEEEFDRNSVCAFIEVRVSPEIQCGYDDVAAVIAQYDEVSSVYLMSGGYDLAVTIKGTNLRDVAMFVTDRLAPLGGVLSTTTHFILHRYKEHGRKEFGISVMDYENILSRKVQDLQFSGIRKFFDIAASYDDVISLSVGEPDFKTPWAIRKEAIRVHEKGRTNYTANAGLADLRIAINDYINDRLHVSYDPLHEILVTVGGSEAIDLAIRALIDTGDEVLIPQPSFVCYGPIVTLANGTPVAIETSVENGFKLTAEALKAHITPKTKALVLPYPNNPTGAVMRKSDLEAIAEVIRGTDIIVISDEIYSELTYGDEEHCSIVEIDGMKERTVLINGFSKAFSMTGWRLGFAAGPAPIVTQMLKIHQYGIMCSPTMSQYAAITALKDCKKDIEYMRGEYDMRRRLIVKGFNEMGLDCFEPEGAFYIFPSIRKTGLSSQEFCEQLIEKHRVAVVPGDAFGKCGEGYIRVSYAYSLQHIKTALERIRLFLEDLGVL